MAGMGTAMAPARARLARAVLLLLLALPAGEAAAQKPEDRFTPLPAPTVALPRLTPSDGARAEGLTPGAAWQPPPVVAPPLSPIRVPGTPPTPPQAGKARPAMGPSPAAPPPEPPAAILVKPADAAPIRSAEPAPPPPAPRRVVITVADVKLRAAPGTGARVVDELERGTRLDAIGPERDGWIPVGRGGKALGYVAAGYVADARPATADSHPKPGRYAKASRADNGCALPDDVPSAKRRAPLPNGTVARVQADANLRVAPACDAKVADVLESGDRVTVLEAAGSWYRVGRNGRTLGYVGAALLAPAKGR